MQHPGGLLLPPVQKLVAIFLPLGAKMQIESYIVLYTTHAEMVLHPGMFIYSLKSNSLLGETSKTSANLKRISKDTLTFPNSMELTYVR